MDEEFDKAMRRGMMISLVVWGVAVLLDVAAFAALVALVVKFLSF